MPLPHTNRSVPWGRSFAVLNPERVPLPLQRTAKPGAVRLRHSLTGRPGIVARLIHPMSMPPPMLRPTGPAQAEQPVTVQEPGVTRTEVREWQGHKYVAVTDAGQQIVAVALLDYGVSPVSDVIYHGMSLKKVGALIGKDAPGAQDVGDWMTGQVNAGMGIVIVESEEPLPGDKLPSSEGLLVATKSILVAETLASPGSSDGAVLIEPAGGWTEEAEEAGSSVLLYVGLGVAAVAGLYLVTRK